jgi:hypothetical protein
MRTTAATTTAATATARGGGRMRSRRLRAGRLGMDWFRPRYRLHALLATIAKAPRVARTLAANERAMGLWTSGCGRRAGSMNGSYIADT